jgi:hypothetical protein
VLGIALTPPNEFSGFYAERPGELAERRWPGLGGVRFESVNRVLTDAGGLGEFLLGHSLLYAELL